MCTFSRRFKVTVPQKAEFGEVLPEFLPVEAGFLKILFTEGPTEDSKTRVFQGRDIFKCSKKPGRVHNRVSEIWVASDGMECTSQETCPGGH